MKLACELLPSDITEVAASENLVTCTGQGSRSLPGRCTESYTCGGNN